MMNVDNSFWNVVKNIIKALKSGKQKQYNGLPFGKPIC